MTKELTHASFFSGAGGLDMGLERAGWRTVSFSEIDPYASAVLAQRWPGITNLGDIVQLARRRGSDQLPDPQDDLADAGREGFDGASGSAAWQTATLWTGGFPCQDLSVAGKRRGFVDGTRSSLAFAYLALVERHRPPIVVLENVPGLLSSNGGRDLGRLIGEMAQLGYMGAYRVLDARYFGVPQRRRRVFIVGVHASLDPTGERAAQVLAVGYRCDRHPPAGLEAGPRAARRPVVGVDIAGNLTRRYGKGVNSTVDDGAIVVAGALNNLGHHGWTANAQSVAQGHIVVGAITGRPYDDRGHENGHLVSPGAADDAGGGRAPDRRQEPGREGGQGPAGSGEHVRNAGHGRPGDAVRGPDGASADADRDGAPDGLAGRLDDSRGLETITGGEASYHQRDRIYGDLAPALDAHAHSPSDPPIVGYRKATKAREPDGLERWERADMSDTVDASGMGAVAGSAILGSSLVDDEVLLPLGLDSHRYRCCGNGVVADVGEWIGARLVELALEAPT